MKRTGIGLIALAILAQPAAAIARDSTIAVTLHRFVDAFNKGDGAGAAATMADKVTITDEVAPFLWDGKDAFAGWGADYGKDATAKGITNPAVAIGEPTRQLEGGATAYVIVPATYTFRQKGVAMAETAQMTFTLTKQTAGWKITSWTWTGPDAAPVK